MPFEHSTFGWFAYSLYMSVCGRPSAIFYSASQIIIANPLHSGHTKRNKKENNSSNNNISKN
jgi:hypothetical protein